MGRPWPSLRRYRPRDSPALDSHGRCGEGAGAARASRRRRKTSCQYCQQGIERLNNIITDFLNYSREKTYEFQQADVRGLLDETLHAHGKKPRSVPNTRLCVLSTGTSCARAWTPTKIKQVFWNLCDNALRAMPEGGTLT